MDKQAYGELIVNSIITEYRNSKDYGKDAARYLYRWLKNIINARTANVGDQFLNDTNGCENMTKDSVNKFMSDMAKNNDLGAKLDELFGLLSDETADHFCPILWNGSADKTPYPDFLKD